MKPLRSDEVQDMKNAWQHQQTNSVEGSAYHGEYCDRCGNKTCTCLYLARARAKPNGFLSFVAFVLFLLAGAILAKALHYI